MISFKFINVLISNQIAQPVNKMKGFTPRYMMMLHRILIHWRWSMLLFGIIIGTSIGFVLVTLNHLHSQELRQQFKKQPLDQGFRIRDVLEEPVIENTKSTYYNMPYKSFMGRYHYSRDNSSVADILRKSIRIICWIWCSGRDIQNQTIAIYKTWGRKCDKVLIFTDRTFQNVTSIDLSNTDIEYSTSRYIMAYRYVYKHYNEDADWFFGTFDEIYVCMENLRIFLAQKDTNKPFYYGHKLLLEEEGIEFVDARVGCVLSKAALQILGKSGRYQQECNKFVPAGEKQLGACLNNIGVHIGVSTDSLGKTQFLSFAPSIQMQGSQSDWFVLQDQEGLGKGVDSISNYAITFSGMTSFFMYGIEYYLYNMRPFGIFPVDQTLNVPDEL